MHLDQRFSALALRLARLLDQLRETLANGIALHASAVAAAIAAFVAEQQAVVHHLQQPEVLVRALRNARQQLEKFFAAPAFVVKGNQHAVAGPDAARAPRSLRRGFVQRAAQAVARADNHLERQSRLLAALLELADFINQRLTQASGIVVRHRLAKLHHGVQQRRRSLQ